MEHVISGTSVIVSGSAAAEAAGTVSLSFPPHVDPVYGQVPVTGYLGSGGGGAYAGLGAGITHSLISSSDFVFP